VRETHLSTRAKSPMACGGFRFWQLKQTAYPSTDAGDDRPLDGSPLSAVMPLPARSLATILETVKNRGKSGPDAPCSQDKLPSARQRRRRQMPRAEDALAERHYPTQC